MHWKFQKPTVKADMPVLASLTDLLPILAQTPYAGPTAEQTAWLDWVQRKTTPDSQRFYLSTGGMTVLTRTAL